MRKIFPLLLVILFQSASAQTKLVSHYLDLKKSENHHQAIAAVNSETKEVFLFASDKELLNIHHYNNAFFFKDSLIVDRPLKDFPNMSGYSFFENAPFIYWGSADLKRIQAIKYDIKNKSAQTTSFELPFKEEQLLMQFNENNTFYLISQISVENKLKLYVFNGAKLEEKVIDLSNIKFTDNANRNLSFKEIIALHPIRKMEQSSGNSLVEATFTTKMFVQPSKILISFDHKSIQTQILEIDLQTFEVTERIFLQPQLKQPGKSNSFINTGNLFQCKANADEFVFEVKNYDSGEIIKSHQFTLNDTVSFKNSPLLSQTGSKPPRLFKNTAKFLSRINESDVAVSAYLLPNNHFLVSFGGTRNVTSPTAVLLGATVLAAEVLAGTGFGDPYFDQDRLQVAFFDSLFDDNFKHLSGEPEPMAIDFISNFVSEQRDITLENTFKFRDFYVLGYYDVKAKQYIFRKFEDGFGESNTPFFKKRPAIETGF